MEKLLDKVLNEVNNGNKPKDLPLEQFFSRFCALKGLDENHPTAIVYRSRLNLFFKFLAENHPKVGNLNELTPIMISKFVRYLKARQVHVKKYKTWEKISDRTINSHIRGLRYLLEILDKVGTQELREPLITIKRPRSKKNPYIPTDEELARVSELLKKLRESRREDYRHLAFIAATCYSFVEEPMPSQS